MGNRPKNIGVKKRKTKARATAHATKADVSVVQEKYCIYRGHGHTMREAANLAGLGGARITAGVTQSEWERLPAIQERIRVHRERAVADAQMEASELNARLAQMGRGDLVAKSTEKFGDEYHQRAALEALSHNLGLRKSQVSLNVSRRPDLSGLTDDEIETLLRIEEKARGEAGDGREPKAGG